MSMGVEILYEDADVVAVNKPAGLVVHGSGKTDEPTLSGWAITQFPEMKNVGEPLALPDGTIIERHGIVHRIDRETSGVLILAKNREAFVHLKSQFQDREVEKEYRAFVYGIVKDDAGVIDRPIAKSKKNFRLWSAQRGGRGEAREAQTAFRVLERGNESTYLSVRPHTGRTHQIRVHCKAINHPVVCDALYAPKREPLLGFTRLALHAHTLSLTLPSGEDKQFTAPLPPDFEQAMKLLHRS